MPSSASRKTSPNPSPRPYRPDDSDNRQVELARSMFLDLYAQHRPELLPALRDRALKLYGERCHTEDCLLLDFADWNALQYQSDASDLVLAITNWMMEFGLTFRGELPHWPVEFVLATLHQWNRSPKKLQELMWTPPIVFTEAFPEGEPGFFSSAGEPESEIFLLRFEIEAWAWAAGESKPSFRQRFNKAAREVRENHIAEIEREIGKRGLEQETSARPGVS